MARRSSPSSDLDALHQQAVALLVNFKAELAGNDLRTKVRALIPAVHALRDFGSSLMLEGRDLAARDRIINYLIKYPHRVIDGDELMVVSGIGEWARRLRELRVEFGWWINSGQTFRDMVADSEAYADVQSMVDALGVNPAEIGPDQYVLLSTVQDREAAHRWNVLNTIKKQNKSVADKLLAYLRVNVGKLVTGEELRYLAGKKSEWARRTRELRTQAGWPLKTRSSGRPDLPVGVYVLEADRQTEKHDRQIPDLVRVAVLKRDLYKCTQCGWSRVMLNPDDPRTILELHHVHAHVEGGQNTVENLLTICNVCHDSFHAGKLAIAFPTP
jgi:5-methylcytosine-specific restriction endonuclease McrA